MRKKTIIFAFIAIFAIGLSLILSGCEKPPIVPPIVADDNGTTSEGVSSVVQANNQFAFELYSEFKDEYKESNVFFSPYSISTALAMTYEGARGQTADEMQSVFHFPEDAAVRRPAFAKVYNQINKEEKNYTLSTANALWAEKSYSFLNEYIDLIESSYAGKVTNLDFKKDAENSRRIINAWVEKQTNDKIKNLIPSGVLGEMTRLVITNAVYFKGNWLKHFDKENTNEEDFRASPDNTIKVQMMFSGGEFNYAETEELQILEMHYEGKELSMLVLLPKEDDLESLEESLDAEKLSELKNMLEEQPVDVYMPKFTFDTKYSMVETLKNMGMLTAFSAGNADFSGMDGTRNLYISDVIHQAFVEVNEEGTEAAAATAVVMKLTMAPAPEELPPVFRADHPFIFIIQDSESGNILFLGKVADPTK